MTNIITEIEEIMDLARRVHRHIETEKITKARQEVLFIIELGTERLRLLRSQQSDSRLLQEWIETLSNAKKALRDLDSVELWDEAKELMDKIVEIQKKELEEIDEKEKREDDLYDYWHNHFRVLVFYHGTSSLAVQDILQHGLDPNRRPVFWQVAFNLRNKLETILWGIFSFDRISRTSFQMPTVHLTLHIDYASALPISETITKLLTHAKTFIPEIERIIQSRGNYRRYVESQPQSLRQLGAFFTEAYFSQIDFVNLRRDLEEIKKMTNVLETYVNESRNVLLKVDAIGILNELRVELKNAILSFNYFKTVFYPQFIGIGNYPKNINWILSRRLHDLSTELTITRRIDPKFIHVA